MDLSLALAYQALGSTAPNPAVGCVLVKDGVIIATGVTGPGGRPHGEARALDAAGDAAQGATAYVSLEPCAHHGKTPPCADHLIRAKVARVVIACLDPFPQVDGRGLAKLQAAGIALTTGVRERDALDLNAGFFHRVRTGKPLVYEDERAHLYEACLKPHSHEDLDAHLVQLGQKGISRLQVHPQGTVGSKREKQP
ncbi:bifunctional diaminohydroxyphosphoribosylaminopyrimidine deaminase/5-amino-6-(5-phosphoribosylamino)uracil reductase RibD [Woodsholea maritima]|uniref:bifunctional diaminohydroxyphosphoribosylaminopyrimidine deaminase/5-amino-6-(5-phosphoribosylamino)uracil reductase RibD n=1 Tax=Woodsholea maritima TaxID=240237 RepID=UPI00036AB6FA|nr:bifunctional diaminohydroxyphosphoribosylaminopyrimidine deaminase/5-amino-6-(5-phosphoribosylamino)uracil reductase RibD [Woodsholea maritima]